MEKFIFRVKNILRGLWRAHLLFQVRRGGGGEDRPLGSWPRWRHRDPEGRATGAAAQQHQLDRSEDDLQPLASHTQALN